MKFWQSIVNSRKTHLFIAMLLTVLYVPSVQAHIDGTHHAVHGIDYGVVVRILLLVAIGLLVARSKSRL